MNLITATRSETRSAIGNSRTCGWTDSNGTHTLNDVDCNASVPWFAPLLAIQPTPALLPLLNVADEGQVVREGATLRQVSFYTPLQGDTTAFTNLLTTGTKVSVLFDPQTLLPSSMEYLQHADNDLNTTFSVRITYSNYQKVSGVPIPFEIDRYVNNALQLALSVNSASLK